MVGGFEMAPGLRADIRGSNQFHSLQPRQRGQYPGPGTSQAGDSYAQSPPVQPSSFRAAK